MPEPLAPVVVAFDGSPAAEAALRTAAALFADRRLIIVTVWESGLAMMVESSPDVAGVTQAIPSREEVVTVDRALRQHAGAVADAGVRLARDLGATAVAVPVRDSRDVAETTIGVADEHGAAVIIVGSRGLRGLRSRMLGSTSRRLLRHGGLPLLIVRAPSDVSSAAP